MRKMATLLLAAAFGIACSSNDSVVSPNVVAADGVYSMQSVDGQPLPYVIYQQDTTTITVLDARLTVVHDGSWTEVLDFRVVAGTDTTTETATGAGPWYQNGN